MRRDIHLSILFFCSTMTLLGCGSKDPVQLVATDGIVTLQGKPLADANVTFVPEGTGPVSMGRTDLEGKFRLSTGTRRGAVVGKSKITVSLPEEGVGESKDLDAINKVAKTSEEAQAKLKKITEMQMQMAKNQGQIKKPASAIPEKYLKAETTPLSETVKANGDNHFKFDL